MKLFSRKANPVGGGSVMVGLEFNPKINDVKSYIKEGFKQNPVIYHCIDILTKAFSSAEIEVHKGDKVLESHWALDLLKRPNPTESQAQFIRHIFTDFLIGGNLFVVGTIAGGKPKELWGVDQRFMTVVPGVLGLPLSYKYDNGSFKKEFPVDQVTGRCDMFHYKKYDPENIWLGMSPMQPAALSGDAHNNGLIWNAAMLQNGARPSGVIRFKGTPGKEVIALVPEFFSKRFFGASNAGKVPILPNEAEWQKIDQSPKDMDFITGLQEYAKYICLCYDIPLPLIDNKASTFNNMEQAKEMLWTDTILPLLNDFLDSFGNWLFGLAGEKDLKFSINQDNILALEALRERRFKRMGQAVKDGLITINEGREALDYSPIPGNADILSTDKVVDDEKPDNTGGNPKDAEKHEKWLKKVMEPVGTA